MNKKYYKIVNIKNKNVELADLVIDMDDYSKSKLILTHTAEEYKKLNADWFMNMWAQKGIKVITGEEIEHYLSIRVCPKERHNIRGILEAYGLDKYDYMKILLANGGECDRDNLCFIKDSEFNIH